MAVSVSAARRSAPQPAPVPSEPAPRVPPFSAIYREYFDFVWSSARRQGVGLDAIDDLVQEVFIVIHARLGTLEQPESLRSWIYGIVRRTVSTYHRARRTRAAGSSVPPVELRAWQPTPLDEAEHKDEVRLLSSLLESLDASKREVFVLAELEELTAPEIASMLGIPLNTAYSRLRTARQAFDQALARHNAQRGGRPCRT
jgi:RNA polymerase sigma-70 factor (ECF subfamily)